jgi:hypothetical protein
MFCPSCGATVGEKDLFCTTCGKSLSSQETEVYSFGPFGVNVCFSRPGTFVLMQKNNTKVVLTNQKIYGLSIFNNSTRFQVPYTLILAKEIFDYRLNLGLWKVIWIKFMEREKTKEVSIMGFGSNSANIVKAFDIVSARSTSPSSR